VKAKKIKTRTKKRVRVAKGKVKRTYKKAKASAKRAASRAKQKLRGGAKSKPSPKRKFACARCFTAGTKIVTDKGKKDIQTIRLGDKVLAKDPNTGKQAFKTVQILYKRTVKELYEIKIGKEKLQTTSEHPFWVKNKGWVVAKNLKPGDFFQTAARTYISIDQIQRVKKNAVVYNFTVEDFHTYYVSDLQIFTHNTNECGPGRLNPKEIHFMQSSAKNSTGSHTVLGNAEALKDGTLKPEDLPAIRVWKDSDGKIWTLDHRRLIAYRLANLDDVPVEWASKELVKSQMWKMSTGSRKGKSIRLKLGDGKSREVY
ncbi:polymorphic toxin-type HINT domain-containing protein, partial [Laceyella putida]